MIKLVLLENCGQVEYQNGKCLRKKEESKWKNKKMINFLFKTAKANLVIKISILSDHEDITNFLGFFKNFFMYLFIYLLEN